MSLEIKSSGFQFRNKQVCGGCFNTVHSTHVFEGSLVMVGPKTRAAAVTGWGDSSFFGRVVVAFDSARPILDNYGVVHFIVPTAIEGMSISGRLINPVVDSRTLGHELKPLG